MVAGDVDRDGDLDLMTTGESNDIAFYLNDGVGTFDFPYRMGVVPARTRPFIVISRVTASRISPF